MMLGFGGSLVHQTLLVLCFGFLQEEMGVLVDHLPNVAEANK